MGKNIKKTSSQKIELIESSKKDGILVTARNNDLHYQTLKNWVDIYALSGKDGLEKKAEKIDPELKRLYVENEQLKLLIAEKELELRIKNELLKKTSYQTNVRK